VPNATIEKLAVTWPIVNFIFIKKRSYNIIFY